MLVHQGPPHPADNCYNAVTIQPVRIWYDQFVGNHSVGKCSDWGGQVDEPFFFFVQKIHILCDLRIVDRM
ncbi:MAG TPA: hypothetical protein VGI75_13145 [Pirellulales bacterium]